MVVSDVLGNIVYKNNNLSVFDNDDFGSEMINGFYFVEIIQSENRKTIQFIKTN